MFVPKDWEWDKLFTFAADYMNAKGSNWQHSVASSNQTLYLENNGNETNNYDDGAMVLVISWKNDKTKKLREIETPSKRRFKQGDIRFETYEKNECKACCTEGDCTIF